MPIYFDPESYAVVQAACERLIPAAGGHPGATALGVADYVDGLLGAFLAHPPRIWAGGPFSGRHGGEASFGRFLPLSAFEELAWRTRIEGSQGIPEREFNGPVPGWQQEYRDGVAALGTDFVGLPADEQDARLDAVPEFKQLLYEHACQGAYGAPEYGGNRDVAGWRAIGFPGDVQPRGYTDDEVTGRD
ncbi:MAG TPA: gluconate 2-dehydrogenase subunit 3 family protein [Acidimicrobiia bacterium]|nr:gluconate 2-dehydrogenase subunit 3 family protein [Acidimicrobiia bacterium]